MRETKERYCIFCGEKLSDSPVEISVGLNTFCSQKCHDEYYKTILKSDEEGQMRLSFRKDQ